MRALRVPAIVTLHTVLKQPSSSQALIVQKLAAKCAHVVVMSKVAKDLLASAYGVQGPRVRIIPHGIPVMDPQADQLVLKAKFGVADRRLLLTFGLLSPNKGIETVIRALPAVVRVFPDVMYFVVGATHPVVRRREGEAYRTMLEREAEQLGVREHVMFRGQFVSDQELRDYLQAAGTPKSCSRMGGDGCFRSATTKRSPAPYLSCSARRPSCGACARRHWNSRMPWRGRASEKRIAR